MLVALQPAGAGSLPKEFIGMWCSIAGQHYELSDE